jgi:ubiquinone/menaquinone biosynthesis C-methylase UbiE
MATAEAPPTLSPSAARHDAYAAGYDEQVRAYDCYLAEALFGLAYEFVRPGERLLDLGIGSGLSAELFAKAGLRVWGVDFSPAMLDLCRAKRIAVDLRRHDLQDAPWPYAPGAFDHAVCCGVLHFIADPQLIFEETARVLQPGGIFAFTTKWPVAGEATLEPVTQTTVGEIDIFAQSPASVVSIMERCGFERLKRLHCYVGEVGFLAWVVRKQD